MIKPPIPGDWEWIKDNNGVWCWHLDADDLMADCYPDDYEFIGVTIRKYRQTYNVVWETLHGDDVESALIVAHLRRFKHDEFEANYARHLRLIANAYVDDQEGAEEF